MGYCMARDTEHDSASRLVGTSGAVVGAAADDDSARRWLILSVVCLAQLMVVLDATIVNIALPTAQHDLSFSNADRQWVVTATRWPSAGCCCLAAGSRT
jgi:hypothetical protein